MNEPNRDGRESTGNDALAPDLSEASLYGDNPEVLETTALGPDGLDDEVRELLQVRGDLLAKRRRRRWVTRLAR